MSTLIVPLNGSPMVVTSRSAWLCRDVAAGSPELSDEVRWSHRPEGMKLGPVAESVDRLVDGPEDALLAELVEDSGATRHLEHRQPHIGQREGDVRRPERRDQLLEDLGAS